MDEESKYYEVLKSKYTHKFDCLRVFFHREK